MSIIRQAATSFRFGPIDAVREAFEEPVIDERKRLTDSKRAVAIRDRWDAGGQSSTSKSDGRQNALQEFPGAGNEKR